MKQDLTQPKTDEKSKATFLYFLFLFLLFEVSFSEASRFYHLHLFAFLP